MSRHMYQEPTELGIFIHFSWSLLHLSSAAVLNCIMDHCDLSTAELHFGVCSLAGGQLAGAEGFQAPAKPSWPYLCL